MPQTILFNYIYDFFQLLVINYNEISADIVILLDEIIFFALFWENRVLQFRFRKSVLGLVEYIL